MYAKEYNFGPNAHFATINNLPKDAKEWQQSDSHPQRGISAPPPPLPPKKQKNFTQRMDRLATPTTK